eukprot:2532133-Rhodomonas_salina.1
MRHAEIPPVSALESFPMKTEELVAEKMWLDLSDTERTCRIKDDVAAVFNCRWRQRVHRSSWCRGRLAGVHVLPGDEEGQERMCWRADCTPASHTKRRHGHANLTQR